MLAKNRNASTTLDLPALFGPTMTVRPDDSHKPHHFGRAWIEVEAPRERAAIIRAIRAGDFTLGSFSQGG